MALVVVRDEFCLDNRLSHLGLLKPLPAIGIGKDKVDFSLRRVPKVPSVGMGILDEFGCAVKEVSQEVRHYIDGRLVEREGRNGRCNLASGTCLGADVKLKPRVTSVERKERHSLSIRASRS
jgi:hypothetical protein